MRLIKVMLVASLLHGVAWPAASEDEFRLQVGRDVFTLRSFREVSTGMHYHGVYAFPMEYTGGTLLHLFPNGRFVIVEWLDIGPDRLQATGTYRVHHDRLTLEFSRIRSGQDELKKRFSDLRLLYGQIEKKEYVTGFEVFVFSEEEWRKLKTAPQDARYMQRRTEYNDWEKILRDYEAQKE